MEELTSEDSEGEAAPPQKKQKKQKKRKKRRKKRYLLKIFLTLLFLVGLYFLATSQIFNIDSVQVSGNVHFSKSDIIDISGVKVGKGEFKMSMLRANGKLKKEPYIESSKIKRKLPNKVVITIKERTEKFVIPVKDKFALLDYSSRVLEITDAPPSIPVLEGLSIVAAEPGNILAVKQVTMLDSMVDLMKTVEELDLYFMRIALSGLDTVAYISNTFMCKGDIKMMIKNIESIKNIVDDLTAQGIKHGTIIISNNGTCTFTPELATEG